MELSLIKNKNTVSLKKKLKSKSKSNYEKESGIISLKKSKSKKPNKLEPKIIEKNKIKKTTKKNKLEKIIKENKKSKTNLTETNLIKTKKNITKNTNKTTNLGNEFNKNNVCPVCGKDLSDHFNLKVTSSSEKIAKKSSKLVQTKKRNKLKGGADLGGYIHEVMQKLDDLNNSINYEVAQMGHINEDIDNPPKPTPSDPSVVQIN
jgi:hypothetical protein